MTHFLNRILPFLFTKPKPAAPAPKHPMETAEEFACILRTIDENMLA